MFKALLSLFWIISMLCSFSSFGSDKFEVEGKVINAESGQPIAGLKVSLGAYRKTWKFWAMPEFEVLNISTTNEDGEFFLSGTEEKYYVVTLDEDVCWRPYSESFSKDEFRKLQGFVIKTSWSNAEYCH